MKKTRFWLAVCLLVTMCTFTGCGDQTDRNNDAIPDTQQNQNMQQDADDTADDIRNDADDLGNDIKDGIDDAADDVKDAVDGDDDEHHTENNQKDEKQ